MAGEIDLAQLVKNMSPRINQGEYVYCTVEKGEDIPTNNFVGLFREQEGTTIILSKQEAKRLEMTYSMSCAWITLEVFSSLKAVGLTAAFTRALAEEGISSNVVAGFYHDHIFVPFDDAARALKALIEFSGK